MSPIWFYRTIDKYDADNFVWWLVQFQVQEEDLLNALEKVGDDPKLVEKWLLKNVFKRSVLATLIDWLMDQDLPTRTLQPTSAQQRFLREQYKRKFMAQIRGG